jgi:hypothetical protein
VKARLLQAQELLKNGMPGVRLLKHLGLPTWAQMRKDDGGDETDSSDNSDSNSSDSSNSDFSSSDSTDSSSDSSDSDFNAKHPRYPAGTLGGKGGEFAPKDTVTDAAASETASSSEGDIFKTWGNIDTLLRHLRDHTADFGLTTSDAEGYVKQANDFFTCFQEEKLPAVEYSNGGEIGVYDPQSNTFGVYNSDGTTQSFYKPTSPTYFQRQIDKALEGGGKIINPLPTTPVSSGGGGGGGGNPATIFQSDPVFEEEEKKPKA